MKYIDFHAHSYYSDGMSSPSFVVEEAKKVGLSAVALTDHDTVKGVLEAENKAKELNIEFVKGIEISTYDNDCKSIHMLGLMWQDDSLFYPLEEVIAKSRNTRSIEILKELNEKYNFDIDFEELRDYSKSLIIGRGHISRIIKDKGYTKDYKESNSYLVALKNNSSYGIKVENAIEIVHKSKGIAIMAHPYSLKKDDETLFNKIKYYKDNYGLDGIECFHTRQSKEETEKYIKIAKKLDLLISGGSDYHGAYKTEVKLGKGKGEDFFVDYGYFLNMKEYYNKLY